MTRGHGYTQAHEEPDREARVRVTINGEERDVPDGLDVESLLRHLDLDPRLVVVEKNGEILERDAVAGERVSAGDRFELVHFVGGG